MDYEALERELGGSDSVEVFTPEGGRLVGILYYGVAGYGPYYQIRIPDNGRDPLSEFQLGQRILVRMESAGRQIRVQLLLP